MKIVCEACSAKYSIADDKVQGKVFKIRCKKCNHIIVVRGDTDGERQAASALATNGAQSGATAAASRAASAEVPQWYVVVDGEQVGPLTISDIGTRAARGEVTADSFAWTEGMPDWAQISSISALAGIVTGAAARGGARSATPTAAAAQAGDDDSPFAPQPTAVMPAGQVDDMFRMSGPGSMEPAAQTAASAGAAAGAGLDLFAPQRPSAVDDEFNAAPTAVAQAGFAGTGLGPMAGAASLAARSSAAGAGLFGTSAPAAAGAGTGASLTGQRSENSVLFSLSNLEALAAPRPAAALSGGAAGGFSSPQNEGSGLIDIRAMAQMSLGKPSGAGAGITGPSLGASAPAVDFPAFAPAPLSPVVAPLLPAASASSGGMPRWAIAVIAVGVVVIGGMAFAIFKLSSQSVPAVVEVPVPVTAVAPTAPGAAPAALPASPPASGVLPTTPPETPPAAPLPTAAAEPPRPVASATPSKKGATPAPVKKTTPTAPAAPSPGAAVASPVATAEPSSAPAAPAKKPAAAGDSIDELLKGALSTKPASPAPASAVSAPASASAKLGPLSKTDIVKVMSDVVAKSKDCYAKYKVPGMVDVNVRVDGSGKVAQAEVKGKFAGTPSGDCVLAIVKSARFPASDAGMTFPYPIPLR